MPDPIVAAATPTSAPRGLGALTSLIAKGLKGLSPAERGEVVKDAAVLAGVEIGKASDLLEMGDDRGRIGQVEDQWDGPPDDHVRTQDTHGPGSSGKPGTVTVGPAQSASGSGAEKMEGEYSKFAPQSGVQEATERLGRDISGMRNAMKSTLKALEAQGLQIEAVKAGIMDPEALKKACAAAAAEAVTKALVGVDAKITRAVAKAVAKAAKADDEKEDESDKEDESGEEDEEEDEDEEGEQEESGSGTEIEIVNELEEEDESEADEDGKAKAKHAAQLRLTAKSLVRKARGSIVKARDMVVEEKPKAASYYGKVARRQLAKASAALGLAKSIRGGKIGPKHEAIVQSIAKARKGLPPSEAKNQDKWPESQAKRVGKGAAPGGEVVVKTEEAIKAETYQNDINRIVDQLSKAASGVGMLQANMQELMAVVGGQPRNGSLPPAAALAKSDGGDSLASKEAAVRQLAVDGTLGFDDLDRANEVITSMRMALPAEVVASKISRLPENVQSIFRAAA